MIRQIRAEAGDSTSPLTNPKMTASTHSTKDVIHTDSLTHAQR